MGDVGDYWNDVRAYHRDKRRKEGVECIGCITRHPKRDPTILLPGQKCRVCGHKDERTPTAARQEA
jgi:rRNA maturation endonuclease Nob1